jgi:hypothetical protein
VRRSPRRRLKRLANDLGDLVIADLARRAGTGLVIETLDPMLRKPPPPFAHGVGRSPDPQADGLVLRAFRGQKDDARPLGQPLRRLPSRRQTLEFAPLALGQNDRNSHLAHANPPPTSAASESHIFVDRACRGRGWPRLRATIRRPNKRPPHGGLWLVRSASGQIAATIRFAALRRNAA